MNEHRDRRVQADEEGAAAPLGTPLRPGRTDSLAELACQGANASPREMDDPERGHGPVAHRGDRRWIAGRGLG